MLFCNDSNKELREQKVSLSHEFATDNHRVEKLSLKFESIYFDYSKNLVNDNILKTLFGVS